MAASGKDELVRAQTVGDDTISSPAIASDGTLYLGPVGHRLLAVGAHGARKVGVRDRRP